MFAPVSAASLWLGLFVLNGKSVARIAAGFAIVVMISVYPAAWMMRVLIRIFPLRSDGQRRWVLIACLALVAAGVEYLFWSISYDTLALQKGWRALRPGEDGSGTLFFGTIVFTLAIPVTLAGAWPLAWAALRHARQPEKRGLVYLRTFGGAGDTPVARALLGIAPNNTPVAFIASPSSIPGSWDLSAVALAGFKWLRPWSNIPLYLTSRSDTWVDDIRSWLVADTTIALDASDCSTGLLTELALIDELHAGDRAVLLVNRRATLGASAPAGSLIVPYELAWAPALPRIVLMFAFMVTSVAAVDDYLLLRPIGIAVLLLTLPVILQPSVSRASRQSIRNAFRDRARPSNLKRADHQQDTAANT